MRFIAYGVGAVGGAVCAALAEAGQDVVGIARGPRLQAIRDNGLLLRAQSGEKRYRFACVAAPSEIRFRPDDVILLLMKAQHTEAALRDLRDAGVTRQPVFCCQNGVANERRALRFFPNVHGVTVMLPAGFTALDETVVLCAPKFGMFDIGRFPSGSDDADHALADALTPGGIVGYVDEDVMQSKHGKLILNLGNIVEASVGDDVECKDISALLREEGRRVLDAAGIPWKDVGDSDTRREQMRVGEVGEVKRTGSSTTQSLARDSGSIETDYLNGEISLLGRMHGVATPANDHVTQLAARLVRERRSPGSVNVNDLRRALGLA